MKVILMTVSQIVEGIIGSIVVIWLFLYFHYHLTSSKQRTANAIVKAMIVWFLVWTFRKMFVNFYHSYLEATGQSDTEITFHLPFVYEYVDLDRINE